MCIFVLLQLVAGSVFLRDYWFIWLGIYIIVNSAVGLFAKLKVTSGLIDTIGKRRLLAAYKRAARYKFKHVKPSDLKAISLAGEEARFWSYEIPLVFHYLGMFIPLLCVYTARVDFSDMDDETGSSPLSSNKIRQHHHQSLCRDAHLVTRYPFPHNL